VKRSMLARYGAAAVSLAFVSTLLNVPAASAVSVSPTPAVTKTAGVAVGVVAVVPAKGTDQTAFSLVTSKPCPSGTNVIGTVFGPGLPDDGINVVPNTTLALFPKTSTGGLYMPSSNTLRNLIDQLPDPQPLKGSYRLRVECRGPAKIADLGDFTGAMVFDGHHGYLATEPTGPKVSLQTLAPNTELPIPTAIGSHAPESASPTVVKAKPAAATTRTHGSSSALGIWLITGGALVVAVGSAVLVRGRRTQTPTVVRK
jgi:hypothetical protein